MIRVVKRERIANENDSYLKGEYMTMVYIMVYDNGIYQWHGVLLGGSTSPPISH